MSSKSVQPVAQVDPVKLKSRIMDMRSTIEGSTSITKRRALSLYDDMLAFIALHTGGA